MVSDEDLGPLPTRASEHELEQQSFDELRGVLPRELFLLRDDRHSDYGVDGRLEVMIEGHPTNWMAPIQLKARTNLRVNGDGSLSMPIETANLNYLLNSASSIIILFDADHSAFYWASALDEARRIETNNPNWKKQSKISLRFDQKLDTASAKQLHEHLREAGQLGRRLRGQIANLPLDALVHVGPGGRGTTTDDANRDLFEKGWSLAVQGNLTEVQRLYGLMTVVEQQSPRAHLLIAYASYCSGKPVATWMHVAEAVRRQAELDPADRDLLELLSASADYLIGRISKVEMLSVQDAMRVRAAPSTRIQLDVSGLRMAWSSRPDEKALIEHMRHAEQLVDTSTKEMGTNHPATRSAQLLYLEIHGHWLALDYVRFLLLARHDEGPMRMVVHGGETREQRMESLERRMNDWFRNVMAIGAACAGWPPLELEAQQARLLMQGSIFRNNALLDAIDENVRTSEDEHHRQIRDLVDEVEECLRNARALRIDDAEARLRLLLLDLLDLLDSERRLTEAQELVALCRLNGFVLYEQLARSHLENRSSFRGALAEIEAEKHRVSDDKLVAVAGPAQRDEMARSILEMFHLPADRLAVVRDDLECIGTVQELKTTWCKHLEIQQDQRHLASPSTAYTRPPECACSCEVTGGRSAVPSTDWRSVINAFRRSHCHQCDKRAPGS